MTQGPKRRESASIDLHSGPCEIAKRQPARRGVAQTRSSWACLLLARVVDGSLKMGTTMETIPATRVYHKGRVRRWETRLHFVLRGQIGEQTPADETRYPRPGHEAGRAGSRTLILVVAIVADQRARRRTRTAGLVTHEPMGGCGKRHVPRF